MAAWSDHDVTIDGLTIHYYRMGQRGRPPVVLLHGFSDSGMAWVRLASDLVDDYDLILPDAVGHGRSSAPGTEGFRDRAIPDVLALIERLELDRPVLIGHSMGARTAAGVAAEASDRLRGVVLEDPPWRDESGAPQDAAVSRPSLAPVGSPPWRAWLTEFHNMDTEARVVAAREERPNWSEEDCRYWAEGKGLFNLECLSELGPGQLPPWRDTARAITCPVLLITGDPALGGIVTMTLAEEAVRMWHGGSVVNIPNAGHNIRRDQYEPYRMAVMEFLTEHLHAEQSV
jgi:pimeloyl-ACP methyl ester carboxylesterase